MTSSPAGLRRKRIRTQRKKRYAVFLQLIAMRPTVFDLENPKPLAVGVHKKIAEATGVPEYVARWFCQWWCRRPQYRKALEADNSYRYHVSGHRGRKVQDEEKVP